MTVLEMTLGETTEMQQKAKRSLLWLGIISMIMLFGGLTSGYIVRQAEGKWVEFALPGAFSFSTLIIILSSVSMQWGLLSVRNGKVGKLKSALFITLLLGTGFVISQYMAWSQLFHEGIAFSGRIGDIKAAYSYIPAGTETVDQVRDAGNVSGSFLYAITGLHVLHLLGGIIVLVIVFSHAMAGKYTTENYNGVKNCAIFWHFLGILWVYLFLFLLYVR